LAGEIKNVLKEFGLKQSEIAGLVADNTSSMPALARELGIKFRGCDAHKLNLVVTHSLTVSEISSTLIHRVSKN
jgi:hypothetical protein